MPSRQLISKQLAELFGVLANPDRIRIIEELRNGEMDVNGLQKALELPQARVSQQLGILRAHRIVSERRAGRHVFYHLEQPWLAGWILQALDVFTGEAQYGQQLSDAADQVRAMWMSRPVAEKEKVAS